MPVVKTKQTIDDVDPGGLPSVTATDSGACLTGMVKPDRATGSNSWTNRKPRNRRNNFVMVWEFDVLHAEHSKKPQTECGVQPNQVGSNLVPALPEMDVMGTRIMERKSTKTSGQQQRVRRTHPRDRVRSSGLPDEPGFHGQRPKRALTQRHSGPGPPIALQAMAEADNQR